MLNRLQLVLLQFTVIAFSLMNSYCMLLFPALGHLSESQTQTALFHVSYNYIGIFLKNNVARFEGSVEKSFISINMCFLKLHIYNYLL